MKRKTLLHLAPSLLLAAGILLSTWVAKMAGDSQWLVLVGPVILALALVGADLLAARFQGESSGPSPAALLLAGATVLAGFIVAQKDPRLVAMLLLVLGPSSFSITFLRSQGRRKPCRVLARD